MYKLINWFDTTLASSISDTEEFGSFRVKEYSKNWSSLPENGLFYVVVNLNDQSRREIFRIYKRVNDQLFFDTRISPNGKFKHIVGDWVSLNDVGETLNELSTKMNWFGYVLPKGGLNVEIVGWEIENNLGKQIVIPNTSLVLSNNTINYIYFDQRLSKIMTALVEPKNKKNLAKVTTADNKIESITYINRANLWVGMTPNQMTSSEISALNTADILPGTVVFDSTLGKSMRFEWGQWLDYSAGEWGGGSWWTVPNASTTVAGKVKIATPEQMQAGTDNDEDWSTLVPSPSYIKQAVQNVPNATESLAGTVAIATETEIAQWVDKRGDTYLVQPMSKWTSKASLTSYKLFNSSISQLPDNPWAVDAVALALWLGTKYDAIISSDGKFWFSTIAEAEAAGKTSVLILGKVNAWSWDNAKFNNIKYADGKSYNGFPAIVEFNNPSGAVFNWLWQWRSDSWWEICKDYTKFLTNASVFNNIEFKIKWSLSDWRLFWYWDFIFNNCKIKLYDMTYSNIQKQAYTVVFNNSDFGAASSDAQFNLSIDSSSYTNWMIIEWDSFVGLEWWNYIWSLAILTSLSDTDFTAYANDESIKLYSAEWCVMNRISLTWSGTRELIGPWRFNIKELSTSVSIEWNSSLTLGSSVTWTYNLYNRRWNVNVDNATVNLYEEAPITMDWRSLRAWDWAKINIKRPENIRNCAFYPYQSTNNILFQNSGNDSVFFNNGIGWWDIQVESSWDNIDFIACYNIWLWTYTIRLNGSWTYNTVGLSNLSVSSNWSFTNTYNI